MAGESRPMDSGVTYLAATSSGERYVADTERKGITRTLHSTPMKGTRGARADHAATGWTLPAIDSARRSYATWSTHREKRSA